MVLKLGAPLAKGASAMGTTLRLHDIDEEPKAGVHNDPMKFDVTFTPFAVPEPSSLLLFGAGLAAVIAAGLRRRG